MENIPRVGVIIIKDNKILLGKRKKIKNYIPKEPFLRISSIRLNLF